MSRKVLKTKLKFQKDGRLHNDSSKMLRSTPWKWCGSCSDLLPRTNFGSCASRPDGLDRSCKPCRINRRAEEFAKNPEAERERSRRYKRKNRDLVNKKNREYSKTERGRAIKLNSTQLRRTRKKNATPVLSKQEKERINSLYIYAKMLSDHSGVKYHVDHIKPIAKGGTHEYSNLQVITAKENQSKGAKYVL